MTYGHGPWGDWRHAPTTRRLCTLWRSRSYTQSAAALPTKVSAADRATSSTSTITVRMRSRSSVRGTPRCRRVMTRRGWGSGAARAGRAEAGCSAGASGTRACVDRPLAAALQSYSSDVRGYLGLLILVATVSACGSGSGGRRDTPSSARFASAATSRIDRCVDRLLQDTTTQGAAEKEAARRYARNTYCARFEQSGWIYEDGALRIAAQTWLQKGGKCATAREGQPARTVSCAAERGGGVLVLDCALLHVVRRTEVRDYIVRLQTAGTVECDDGSALDELGVP